MIIFGLLIALITAVLFIILCTNIIISLFKKKPFPKKMLIATLIGFFLSLTIYIYQVYFFTFNHIDRDNLQEGPGPVASPTEEYTANAYYEPYGGAAGGVNVLVEITDHRDHQSKIIYYGDAKTDFNLNWVGENTLYIHNDHPEYSNSNRSIRLQVDKEIYHESGFACKSLLLRDRYETCYQS
ncbi:DUF5412 family protein [Alkalibacillus haloalkaliphilus]|uniref:DUF5412 family protein n=1 Tax=Alkalibacillus haloalkaliphilus TaxID=94136 RepID=UPI0029355F5C|nr:DUF5412 family protein [Alkalibacillus haloalkaliphilus]MDV2583223.1 DUF5412 family protein [Alkalibacillus haloalkaliphilus]